MSKRKPLSKGVRFDVFARDGFTCSYCGRTPPEVMLQIDHVIPVSKGGTNDPENLTTSCQSCNLGKSDKILDDQNSNPVDTKRRAQEAMESAFLAFEFSEARKARAMLRDQVESYMIGALGVKFVSSAHVTGLIKAINEFGSEPSIKWFENAILGTTGNDQQTVTDVMKYFYGTLRSIRSGG